MAKLFNKILGAIGIEDTDLEDEYFEEEDSFDVQQEEYVPEPEPISYSSPREKRSKVVNMPSHPSANTKMVVYQPTGYDDTQRIIDYLKSHRTVIVNLEMLDIEIAQRVLDFMSGAIYSLNGTIHKVSKGIFLLAPFNVDITGNAIDETNTFYNMNNRESK
ncbi:MAG: cell division protein SepF [Christensenellales bacterium]|jgi:cell division inhibitor SepF